jgi:predicted RNase H-like nuclease (RuvC/YqgF family)
MKEEMLMPEFDNEEYMKMLRKNIPQLDMALHINKSNVEHIEFLENKIIELEKNLIDEYQYINNLTNITDEHCIREYTDIMIKELKQLK